MAGTKYSITQGPPTLTSRVTSKLQINNLDITGDTDAGGYTCQIVFRNDSRTVPSQRLGLFTSSLFSNLRLPTCSQFSGESTRETLCALNGQIGSGVGNPGGTDVDNAAIDPINVVNPGSGGGGGGIVNIAVYIAVGAVVIFLVVTILVIVICCVCFRGCKFFD